MSYTNDLEFKKWIWENMPLPVYYKLRTLVYEERFNDVIDKPIEDFWNYQEITNPE